MANNKKNKAVVYDKNGIWVEEKTRIKGAIRRTFRLSPMMKEVLLEARVELPPLTKKDGTPGVRPQVRYKCAGCGKLFSLSKNRISVDHISPVVPLHLTEHEMTYDQLVRGIFCPKSNLQVLCAIPMKLNNGKPSCHKLKTDKENYIRKMLRNVTILDETMLSELIDKYSQQYDEQPKKQPKTKKKRCFK